MADEENKDAAQAEEGKEEENKNGGKKKKDEDEDDGDGCLAATGRGIVTFLKQLFNAIRYLFMTIANFLGLCWYPFKERASDCCDCCGKRMNPHLDPAYGGF